MENMWPHGCMELFKQKEEEDQVQVSDDVRTKLPYTVSSLAWPMTTARCDVPWCGGELCAIHSRDHEYLLAEHVFSKQPLTTQQTKIRRSSY